MLSVILSVIYNSFIYRCPVFVSGLEMNMCCGTHVRNLSDIQV